MKRLFILVTMITIGAIVNSSRACTGITLHSADGATITARTIEWAGNDLESRYSVVPRGYTQQSYVPGGLKEGMTFKALEYAWSTKELPLGSSSEKSFSHLALRIFIIPFQVKSIPLRPLRVGITQSNMSTPRAMPSRMLAGVPTPIR